MQFELLFPLAVDSKVTPLGSMPASPILFVGQQPHIVSFPSRLRTERESGGNHCFSKNRGIF